ncbi:MAG: glycosyl transferase family 28 [Acidimicrobiales bacterium]|nr:glycosyl transferase family 28 [Acidimicrobiales bacterium]
MSDRDRNADDRPAAVVVSVGTDHHRFDRLVDWADAWAGRHPEVQVLVQYGTSHPPSRAAGRDYLPFDELRRALSGATVVVSHGGPATIMDARAVGRRPIVVPRDPDLGEHVDGHQQRFSRWMAERGQVELAVDEGDLGRRIDTALADPGSVVIDTASGDVAASVARFSALVDRLLDG